MESRRKLVAVCTILSLALMLGGWVAAAPPGGDQKGLSKQAAAAEEARRPVVDAPVAVGQSDRTAGGAASLAPLVVLYDQTTSVNANATSQNFETAYDAYDNQAADDFVVPAGGGWNVTTVYAPGAYSATHGTPASMRVAFYQDAAGIPGALICDFPAAAFVEAPVGAFTITLPGGCILTPGLKWVSVVANLNFGGGGGQWFWSTRTLLTNNPSKWQNPGGGFATTCASWGTRTTCLSGQTDPDMAFSLSGNVATCNTDPDCNDGNLCNGVETCVGGSCVAGTPVNCDDGDFCTLDACVPATGACTHAPNPCDDGDSCTLDSCVVGTGCAHVSPPTVQFCSAGAMSIPTSGTATPYPSPITVSGLGTTAYLCSVALQGLSHTWPDDIDILLAGPLGGTSNAIIMSDVGGSTAVNGLSLTLKDAAAASLPDAGPLVAGTFKPTNVGTGDTFAAPAPTPAGTSALSVFNATNPNGTWSLYVVDDTAGDSGTLQGWCVNLVVAGCGTDSDCSDGNLCNGVETCSGGTCQAGTPVNCDDSQFCTIDTCVPATGACVYTANPCDDGDGCTLDTCDNATQCSHANVCVQFCGSGLAINDGSAPTPGAPYPSSISVSGLGPLALVGSVQLLGLSHTYPDDIDMMLVGPLGGTQNATIMSDVGGSTDAVALNLTLTDGAATSLPDAGPLVSGTFKPTNAEAAADVFPAPAPAPTGGSALSVFTGNPNGTWDLYVADDTNVDSGTLQGWCLNLRPTCGTAADCDDGNPCTTDSCVATVCQHANNTNACDDGNACTVGDVCSGGACSGTLIPPPAPVNDSLYVSKTLGVANLVWSDPLGPYNVYRGSRTGAVIPVYNHVCFLTMVPVTNADDPAMPGAGSTFYYLVSRKDPCGESVLGYASNGFPIPNLAPCP